MVNVYMNPEKLEGRIAGLEDFAQSAIESQATVHCMYAKDPIKSGESLESLELAVVNAANAIKSHAEELRKCKTTMVNLNSNGVASHDLEGGISIEVPDDSAGLETADKFGKWAQGATDANDLRSGKDKPPSGRSIDEVRESMKTNESDTTYANSFIDRAGPENLIKLGNRNPTYNREAPVVGQILATASQTWNEDKSKKNAALITESLLPPNKHHNAMFNKIMRFQDANGDGVNDVRFGTNFLLSLGREIEAKDDESRSKRKHPLFYGGTDDPFRGILDAMSGNEEAARGFLTPNGGDEDDVQRVKEIMDRNGIGDNSWTDTWTRISSITSEAHGADHYDGTDGGGSASKQAAAIASSVVNGIGEPIMKNKGYDSISGAARWNLRKTVSCYPCAFDNIATGTGDPNSTEPEAPDQADEAWSKGIGYQPKFTVAGLAGVTQTISRDENEFKALTESVGGIEKRRMTHAIANRTGNPETDDELGTAIRAKSNVAAFLMGASRAPIEGDADAIDKRNNFIIDSVFAGTAFIPGLGENAKQIWKDSYEFAKSNATNMLKNEATDRFTGNLSAAIKDSGIAADKDSRAVTVSTVIQLIELGYIDKNSVNETINVEEDGKRVAVVNDEGKVDLSRMKGKTVKSVMDQLYNRYAQESTHLKGDANQAFVDSKQDYQNCLNMGQFGNSGGKQ
jgi:hypothetical protein